MAKFEISAAERAELGRVAVIYGGNSAERPVSLKSGAQVLLGLQQAGVDAFGIDLYGEDGQQCPLTQLQAEPFDRAFLILHGRGGEDGVIQGLLEMLEINYTGSGVAASALAMDKLRSKQLFMGAGIPTPEFVHLDQSKDPVLQTEHLGYPQMVKPAHEGSSIGMARVNSPAELQKAVASATEFDGMVLVEKWMTGSEFTVAVLDGRALPVIKLETPHDFYDYDAKYESDDTSYMFEHELTEDQVAELQTLAERTFEALGCEGWARIDIMRDEAGEFRVLEANTAPGMTDHSLVPMAARQQGISFEQLVVEVLRASS